MSKVVIPPEWELGAGPRYKRQNMEKAMRAKIERGLVELITNSDDSYRNMEEDRKQASGKICIEIARKMERPRIVIVRDQAEGMDRLEMYWELGTMGRRTSGFEKGKPRRGLNGRGARDVAAFGTVHFESIKDDEYNNLIIPLSLNCRFMESKPKKATSEIRKKLGMPNGNGTVVTIEVGRQFNIPQHERLLKDFSRYYSLRDLFSNPQREVTLVDRNKKREDRLFYRYPDGELVYDEEIVIPGYPAAKARLLVYKHPTPFEQDSSSCREGILIKSAAAIHDCTYFGLESEAVCWRLTGQLFCEYIDQLVREYDDREEANLDAPGHPEDNPQRLLDPSRDGLISEHPFARALYKKCREVLEPIIEGLKATEQSLRREVTDKNLERKLRSLSKEISKVFEYKLKELEEKIPPGTISKELSIGLHIMPPEEQPIIVDQPKTFSVIVKHYETIDDSLPVNVISSNPDIVRIRTSPVLLGRLLEDGKVGRTTFTIESAEIGAEAYVEARYGGYSNLVLVKVVEPPPSAPITDGLSFDKPLYHVQVNKEKTLLLRLKTDMQLGNATVAEITSDHPEIIVKGGGRFRLTETNTPGLLCGQCRVLGRQLKAQGDVTARVEGFQSAQTSVEVVEKRLEPGIDFKPPKPVDDDFGAVRYQWDRKEPYLLLIGAQHSSIRRYLGEPSEQGYPGTNTPLYHVVLAEVVAEALAFRLLSIHFKRDGEKGMLDYADTNFYYHKHFSEFLSIAHRVLVTELP